MNFDNTVLNYASYLAWHIQRVTIDNEDIIYQIICIDPPRNETEKFR